MKRKDSDKRWLPRIRCLLLVLALGFFAVPEASAQIIANFDGGDSTEVVDAWTGKGGDGWKAGWSANTVVGSVALTAGTTEETPLSSGGKYLQVAIQNNDTRARPARVSRQYESHQAIHLAQAHTVTFEFRLDSTDPVPTLWLFDAHAAASNPRSEDVGVTWAIRRFEDGRLSIYNGTSAVSTGMTLDPHKVYRFTIELSPSTVTLESSYRVMIENLTDATATPYLSAKFYSAQSSLGGFLNFSTNDLAAGNAVAFSLDSIAVIPEPSPLALAAYGVLLLIGLRAIGRRSTVNSEVR